MEASPVTLALLLFSLSVLFFLPLLGTYPRPPRCALQGSAADRRQEKRTLTMKLRGKCAVLLKT